MSIDNIKNILKNRRIELGLTMGDVAEAVGVSEATISRWESGAIVNMKRSRIYSLAKVLQISPIIIMGYDSSVLNDIPLKLLKYYQEKGMSEQDMILAYTSFKEAEERDAMSAIYSSNINFSPEATEIALAYDKANKKAQNMARMALDLPIIYEKYNQNIKENSKYDLSLVAENETEYKTAANADKEVTQEELDEAVLQTLNASKKHNK